MWRLLGVRDEIQNPLLLVCAVLSFAILSVLFVSPIAMGEETKQSEKIASYILLLNPNCDESFRAEFAEYLRHETTGYEGYIDSSYSVLCFSSVKNLGEIESYVLPILRNTSTLDKFVFVYPETMKKQYGDYVATKYGNEYYRHAVLGNADISLGIGYAKELPSSHLINT